MCAWESVPTTEANPVRNMSSFLLLSHMRLVHKKMEIAQANAHWFLMTQQRQYSINEWVRIQPRVPYKSGSGYQGIYSFMLKELQIDKFREVGRSGVEEDWLRFILPSFWTGKSSPRLYLLFFF